MMRRLIREPCLCAKNEHRALFKNIRRRRRAIRLWEVNLQWASTTTHFKCRLTLTKAASSKCQKTNKICLSSQCMTRPKSMKAALHQNELTYLEVWPVSHPTFRTYTASKVNTIWCFKTWLHKKSKTSICRATSAADTNFHLLSSTSNLTPIQTWVTRYPKTRWVTLITTLRCRIEARASWMSESDPWKQSVEEWLGWDIPEWIQCRQEKWTN